MPVTTHAIIGVGEAPEKVIVEGLNEAIKDGDNVAIIWAGKPNATVEAVYDYVIDNEIPFTMYYEEGTTPPRVFREAENGVVQKVRDAVVKAVKSVDAGGKVLFLWDEDKEDDQVDPVFDNKDSKTLVLLLNNGLVPIFDAGEDIPEPTDPVVEKDPDEEAVADDTRFTKDELEVMAAPAVKRYGERLSLKATTKSGIIKELFPDEDPAPLVREADPELEALLAEEEEIASRGEKSAATPEHLLTLDERISRIEAFISEVFINASHSWVAQNT